MYRIRYAGRLAAVVSRRAVALAGHIEVLEPGHPLRRFVTAMALFALEVDAGELPAPYTDPLAALYGRCILIPDDEFLERAPWSDHHLAELFDVPLEQIRLKRLDITSELSPLHA
jgi:hypothetical protein